MALIGRLHPLLIHFPIALVILAAAAEVMASFTDDVRWRTVAVHNLWAAAVFAVMATIAGWRLALEPGMETSPLLEWHRWLGSIGAGVTVLAALTTPRSFGASALDAWIYRITLFAAGALVPLAAHLGGLLVWGADFLRP